MTALPMPQRFNLHEVIDAECREHPADVDLVTKLVYEQIPDHEYGNVLMGLLRPQVVHHYGEQRRASTVRPQPAGQSATTRVVAKGWRERMTVDDWLNVTVVGLREKKPLRDCTHDDLMYAAQVRWGHVNANQAWARKFEAVAAIVHRHNAPTVGDCPVDEVRAVWQDEEDQG